jgi:hypothetical protein
MAKAFGKTVGQIGDAIEWAKGKNGLDLRGTGPVGNRNPDIEVNLGNGDIRIENGNGDVEGNLGDYLQSMGNGPIEFKNQGSGAVSGPSINWGAVFGQVGINTALAIGAPIIVVGAIVAAPFAAAAS